MDLGAYVQIDLLEPLLEENGIKDIKRLRGLRLMKDERPMGKEEIEKIVRSESKTVTEWFIRETAYGTTEFSSWTDYLVKHLMVNGQPRWDRIHGKRRKELKFRLKKSRKRVEAQYTTFNKYAGRDDILYIHTRTGGSNWSYFGCDEYYNTDWFVEKVDDSFDSTYCDIYAKIKPVTEERFEELVKLAAEEETEET